MPPRWLLIGLSLFLASAAIGAIGAPQPALAWAHFGGILMAACLALAIAALPSTWAPRAAWGFGLVVGPVIVLGSFGVLGAVWAQNTVGGVAALGLPFALVALFRPPGGAATRVGAGVAAVLLAALLALSRSRGAMLAGLIAAMVVALWWASRHWGRRRLQLFIGMLGAVGLMGGLLLVVGWPWVAPLIDGVDVGGSDMGRLSIWRETVYLIGQAPLTGWGGGAFEGAYALYARLIRVPLYSYAHHLYLGIAFEQGLGGLLIWLGLWAAAIGALLRADRADRPDRHDRAGADPHRLASLASAVTLGVHGLLDDPVLAGGALPLLFIWAGFAALFGRSEGVRSSARPEPARGGSTYRVLIGLSGCIIVFVAGMSAPVQALWHTNRAAVLLAAQELALWPTIGPVSEPAPALAELDTAVALDGELVAARFRRGLLALNEGDYVGACVDLEQAHAAAPDSRAVTKALGYARLWSGDLEAAAALLKDLPETPEELDAYVYYWESIGQPALSERALALAQRLDP